MQRPVPASPRLAVLAASVALACLLPLAPRSATAQDQPAAAPAQPPGQFFRIEEPITTETINRIRAQTKHLVGREARQGDQARPILIFEIRPGRQAPGQTDFGLAQTLAEFLSTKLDGARQTVAFVPEPLSGYASLVALACDEIIMDADASIGPIATEGQPVEPLARPYVQMLANRKGRSPDLLLGMLDRDAPLLKVTTGDRRVEYVLEDRLPEYLKSHQVVEQGRAWDGGRRGVLSGERARAEGFCKRVAANRAEVANIYNLAGRSTSEDPTLDQVLKPVWIAIDGPLDSTKEMFLKARVEQARQEGVNLVFFEVNSPGGMDQAADGIADLIAGIDDMKTVAYVADRAMGVAALVPLACQQIVFRRDGQMGRVTEVIVGRRGQTRLLRPEQVEALATRAEGLAREKGHPPAVARALVDPSTTLVDAKDNQSGAVVVVTEAEALAEPDRYIIQGTRKAADEGALTLDAEAALAYRIATDVVDDDEQLKDSFGLKGRAIRKAGPSWVDGMVATLNTDWMSWLLLFVGFFMLILELKLPGIGLPAIISALAFLLFFWSRYLSGTADQLEILLFVVGLICLALELFVFPGFGVFGMSGILMILTSVVMASHTFVWPTQEYEYREMGQTLLQVTVILMSVACGAVMLGRYFPSLPLFNRMVLKPSSPGAGLDDPTAKPDRSPDDDSLFFLVGETGRTTTALRPTGKARFGELLVDVTADGFYIEPDSLVEVVEVRGPRVIVKRP